MTAALAAGFGCCAVLLLGRPSAGIRRVDRGLPLGAAGVLAVALAAYLVLAHGASTVLVLLAAGVGAAVVRHVRRRRLLAARTRRADAALAACDGLAADLQAGLPPVTALGAAADDWPEFRPVADAAILGADVPAALRALATRPGAEPLRGVAAAWVVSHRSGAGLAASIALAARSVREDRATARVVETELASAQATARLLALLPVGVLLMGRGVGGDPVAFLVSSTGGLVCLVLGLALEWSGLLWLERIADGIRKT